MDKVAPGKVISIRLPMDTPSYVTKYLNERKKEAGRKFSGELATLLTEAISNKQLDVEEENRLVIPIPKGLTEDQKEWLRNPHTRAMVSQLLFQVVEQPLEPFEFQKQSSEDNKEDTKTFKANSKIANFAAKTFDFDDDD
ncbi:hypothetical protein ACE1TI_17945 [Alteribacillus sp. JSM 102045]|uniref:hypothetical protein n=1 Tax=Alteribacillus sp. JSM 102045 TaxID=1562101 RepID=UPI0035C252EE